MWKDKDLDFFIPSSVKINEMKRFVLKNTCAH